MEEDEGAPPVGGPVRRRTGARAADAYYLITVTAHADAAEAVAALLHEGRTGGVIEEEASNGAVRFRAYLPIVPVSSVTIDALRRRLRVLPQFGLGQAPPDLEVQEVSGEAWATAWKKDFHAFPIGRRFLIVPSWETAAPSEERFVIRLDPGMAFGSGLHPSTQLSIGFMEDVLRPDDRVVDAGTGSGILAIAAALLGAREVLAIDNDPVAVEVARRNVAANGVADRVSVVEADLLETASAHADVIVANLTADAIVRLVREFSTILASAGHVVASGIVEPRVEEVRRSLAGAGLAILREASADEWRALLARKK